MTANTKPAVASYPAGRSSRQLLTAVLGSVLLALTLWARREPGDFDWKLPWAVWGIAACWQFGAEWPAFLAAVLVWWLGPIHPVDGDWSWFIRMINPFLLCGLGLWVKVIRDRWDLAQRQRRMDPLTGLLNRAGVVERLQQELDLARRVSGVISVAYLDCDDFKRINDLYGHATGDQLLWELAMLIKQNLRAYDVSGRLGGDELLVVLPQADPNAALKVVQRLMVAVDQWRVGQPQKFTVSAGVVTFYPPQPTQAEACLREADRAMYLAKESGKHGIRCMVFNEPQTQHPAPSLPPGESTPEIEPHPGIKPLRVFSEDT